MRRLALAGIAAAAIACTGCATGITTGQGLVTHDSAEIRGQVATDTAGSVEYWFEYGPTQAYGSSSPHETWPNLQPGDRGEVGFTLEGLARSTTYHYRVCAQDSTQKGGPGCGVDRTVKTQSFACGETVTTDVRLTGSVYCQSAPEGSNGLTVGAPGITIDLHGYSLQGPGNTTGAAIDNSGGFDDVTVRGVDNVGMYNGSTLSGYGNDLRLRDASGNRILFLRTAVDLSGGSGNEVRRSWLHGKGLRAQNTSGLVVADNVGDYGPMELSGLLDSRILRNDMHPPDWWYCCTDAIRVAGNRNVISDNSLSGWANGLVLLSGAENKLLDNYVVNSKADGILVEAFTAGTVLRGNRPYDNGDDGIDVRAADTRIGYNHTFANGDYGIDAVAGVTDAGGNTASDNGNPAQCRDVVCSLEAP
jgi:parallel beta-helix repeat protein